MAFEARGGKGHCLQGLSKGVLFARRMPLGGGGHKDKRCEVWRASEKVRNFA
jgi:hypothetical protein